MSCFYIIFLLIMIKPIDYYLSLRDRFSIWKKDEKWNDYSPTPWQAIFNKDTNVFWWLQTCKENGINMEKFITWQLKYRLKNNNADY